MNQQSPPKKLSRSRNDRYVGGVAAGIGDHFNVDPVFVRIAFVASLALGGLGLLAYMVLLAVMPVEGDPSEPLPPIEPKRRNLMIGLAVAVGIVAIAIADSGDFAGWLFGFWPGTVFGILFWVVAAFVVVWLFASGKFNRDSSGPSDSSSSDIPRSGFTGPQTEPPPPASTEVVTYADSPSQLSTEVMETRQMHAGRPDTPGQTGDAGPGLPDDSSGEPGPNRPPVRDDGPSTIGRIMVWFAIGVSALIVFCTLFVVSAGATAIFGGVPMAALVILLGAAMVFAGLRGRRQISLWLLTAAIAVTLPMAAVSIADLRVEGSYGDLNKTPLSVVDIPDDGYSMAAGNMTIDLRKFDPLAGPKSAGPYPGHVDLPVTSGMGLTTIIVPDDLCVIGDLDGKAGLAYFRGYESNGVEISQSFREFGTDAKVPSRKDFSKLINLDGEFKLGVFEVVDDTEWRRTGGVAGQRSQAHARANDYYSEGARARAVAACHATLDLAPEPDGNRS